MASKQALFRIVVRIALVLLVLVVCAASAVPIQQRVFRRRTERLLADMQAIELHRTTWAQAQVLMRRWGAWGHYDGTCTTANCKYGIMLSDAGSGAIRPGDDGRMQGVIRLIVGSPVYRWLGGREATFFAGFIVQDGTIWRTFEDFDVDVPAGAQRPDDSEYGLMARVQSRSSLNRDANPKAHWILGGSEPSAEHPEYKAGRPGGCEICMSVEVTYSTSTPQWEIRQLTGFDLSCLTRLHPCTRVEDLLPAARPWHLYSLEGDPPLPEQPPETAAGCKVPVWALGRDAIAVLAVDALSSSTKKGPYEGLPIEEDKVRMTGVLKGSTPWAEGALLTADLYSGDSVNPPFSLPEHLVPGRHYLVLIVYRFPEFEKNYQPPPEEIAAGPGVVLDRCGVIDDTPQNRHEIERGIAQNDQLRIPEF